MNKNKINISFGELSQILAEQFRLYGHSIGENVIVPECLKPLANGREAVVSVTLNRGVLRLVGYDEVYAVRAECRLLKEKLKECEDEKKSLHVLLDEKQVDDIEDVEGRPVVVLDEEPEEKPNPPKKKSKKKREAVNID